MRSEMSRPASTGVSNSGWVGNVGAELTSSNHSSYSDHIGNRPFWAHPATGGGGVRGPLDGIYTVAIVSQTIVFRSPFEWWEVHSESSTVAGGGSGGRNPA